MCSCASFLDTSGISVLGLVGPSAAIAGFFIDTSYICCVVASRLCRLWILTVISCSVFGKAGSHVAPASELFTTLPQPFYRKEETCKNKKLILLSQSRSPSSSSSSLLSSSPSFSFAFSSSLSFVPFFVHSPSIRSSSSVIHLCSRSRERPYDQCGQASSQVWTGFYVAKCGQACVYMCVYVRTCV